MKVKNDSPRVELRNRDAKELALHVVKSKKVLTEVNTVDELEKDLSDLHKACRDGDSSAAMSLASQTELARRDKEGNTALHYACMSGNGEIVRDLIRAGANIRAVNNEEQNLLHTAIIHAHYNVLKVLLKKNKIKLSDKDSSGKTPLVYTAENGHITPLKMLQAYGAEIEQDILGSAALNGCLAYLRHVIELKELKIDVNYQDSKKKTILHHACVQGHLKVIKYILSKVNVPETLQKTNHGGQNVIHVCCENLPDESGVLKYLLEEAHKHGVLHQVINQPDMYTGTSACVLVSGKDKGN